MYKKYMLKCEIRNEFIVPEWNKREYYFDTVEEVKAFIEKNVETIRVEAIFKMEKIEVNKTNVSGDTEMTDKRIKNY